MLGFLLISWHPLPHAWLPVDSAVLVQVWRSLLLFSLGCPEASGHAWTAGLFWGGRTPDGHPHCECVRKDMRMYDASVP